MRAKTEQLNFTVKLSSLKPGDPFSLFISTPEVFIVSFIASYNLAKVPDGYVAYTSLATGGIHMASSERFVYPLRQTQDAVFQLDVGS